MTGAELQDLIVGLADGLGLWWHHEHDSRRSPAGWVDLVLLGWHGARFAELKGSGDTRTGRQLVVAELLIASGLEYRCWTPRDWHDGTIRAELATIV